MPTLKSLQLRQGDGRAAREAYLRALWSKLLPLPLMGLVGGGGREDIPLSAVYTNLEVTAVGRVGRRAKESEPLPTDAGVGVDLKSEARYLEQLLSRVRAEVEAAWSTRKQRAAGAPKTYRRRLTALEAAAAAPRLVLLGPAGSGKSSFARHLALCLAGEELNRGEANLGKLNEGDELMAFPSWPHKAPLPLYLELRKLVRSEAFSGAAQPGAGEIVAHLIETYPELNELAPEAMSGKGSGALMILDGLDETPGSTSSRERLMEEIGDLVRAYPECRVLVTSRPYAFAKGRPWRLEGLGFEEAHLAPFSALQSKAFIDSWYRLLGERGQVDGERAAERGADLWREIKSTAYLQPLAEMPLMLTMMTDLHASGGGRLRGGRSGVYERSVELLLDRWNEVLDVPEDGSVSEQLGMGVDEIRCALERLAFDVHRQRGSARGDQPAEISDAELWQALDRERSKERVVDERRVMSYLHQRSGILMGESSSRYRFPHRSYQEYLAAGHLVRTDFPNLLREVVVEDAALWREVVPLAAGQVTSTPFMLWALLETLAPEPPSDRLEADDPGFERALFAALAIQETGIWRRASGSEAKKLERIRQWLERCVELGALPPPDRAAAGRVLGLLGDQRHGVGVSRDGVPEIDWVEVPAGRFLMGSSDSDRKAFFPELPQHSVELEKYSVSRYPITNAQYAAFVEDGGYTEERQDCWTEAGWGWKEERHGPSDKMPPEFLLSNHPRVNVSWFEADAFCQWLSERLGAVVRLPTEAEWEKAARGTDARIYPWGDTFDPTKCNVGETGIERPCSVGMFPEDASPYGVMDTSGNVWEWTLSEWTANYQTRSQGVEASAVEAEVQAAKNTPGARVFRGGSYLLVTGAARSAVRLRFNQVRANRDLGFRVLLPAPRAFRG